MDCISFWKDSSHLKISVLCKGVLNILSHFTPGETGTDANLPVVTHFAVLIKNVIYIVSGVITIQHATSSKLTVQKIFASGVLGTIIKHLHYQRVKCRFGSSSHGWRSVIANICS